MSPPRPGERSMKWVFSLLAAGLRRWRCLLGRLGGMGARSAPTSTASASIRDPGGRAATKADRSHRSPMRSGLALLAARAWMIGSENVLAQADLAEARRRLRKGKSAASARSAPGDRSLSRSSRSSGGQTAERRGCNRSRRNWVIEHVVADGLAQHAVEKGCSSTSRWGR